MIFVKQIRSLFNPEQFQGWGMTRKYFEGWYFKVVNATGTKAFAFIPGIGMDEAGNSHSFIQVLDGTEKKSEYHTFSSSLFVPSAKGFEVSIGKNYFSSNRIILDLPAVKGALEFSGIVPWPKTWYSPGIMGPYAFAPFMECCHGIVSMDHSISGHLEINGELIDFTGGRGYTEKDWGHTFPSAYVWVQTNHFSKPGISFKASVARIPWVTGTFTGFISGIWFDDHLIRFTTYNRSALKTLNVTDSFLEMEMENRDYFFRMTAGLDLATGLASPVRGLMDGRIEESMTAKVTLVLTEKKNGKTVLDDCGKNSCIEVSGDMNTLMPDK
ncbi:MAG TPA: tocopherol cyclase family protein [Bacteroidales bacterium]|nr:tocopherol cyclase family protein [Bacteroidales bacterium]